MRDLIGKIGICDELKAQALKLMDKDEKRIISLCEKCHKNGFKAISLCDNLTKLCVCACYGATYTKQGYKELGIGDEIFYATMKDIGIWCGNNNNKGLKNTNWIANHLKCELFRIGRLQFQLFPCKSKSLNYSSLPFKRGDNTIYIHIPQGEKLIYSKCVEAIKEAKLFFEKYFKNFHYEYFFCESWLLFEDNYIFMAPNCNILQFQSLFTIEYNKLNDHQAIERIYGKRQLIKKHYAENTSLQRWAKAFLMDGGRLGEGIGTIQKNEI